MIHNNSARALIGAMNILVAGGPMLATQTSHIVPSDRQMEVLNSASLKSIESSWLNVPSKCKARAFNASAVSLETKEVRTAIQDIYSSFEV